MTSIDTLSLYRRFLHRLKLHLPDGAGTPLPYEDLAPLVYLQVALGGLHDGGRIKHIIIDEAQDYTVLQYELMRLFFRNCPMTILGDLNQSVNAYLNVGRFEAIRDVFGEENSQLVTLKKSYRSTREISDFCNRIKRYESSMENLGRQGLPPTVTQVTETSLPSILVEKIQSLQQSGHSLIAVICMTFAECESLYRMLLPHVDVELIGNHQDSYHGGTILIPSYLAKGLEFDAVLVPYADREHYSREEDRTVLYTICTRALHELHLYHTGAPSPFLQP